jgi:hypothetical protein
LATRVSLTALTERVNSDEAIPPGLKYFLLMLVDITGSQVKPLKLSRGPSSPAGGGDGIALVAFVTFIFEIPATPWHPEMQFVIRAIVIYRDVWVSACELKLLNRHFGGQIVEKNSIGNTCCFPADDHGRRWVLRLLDTKLNYS